MINAYPPLGWDNSEVSGGCANGIKKNCCTLRVAPIGKRNIYILLSWGSARRSNPQDAIRKNTIRRLSEPCVDRACGETPPAYRIADSDARIVVRPWRWYLFCVHQMTAQDIAHFDVRPWFEKCLRSTSRLSFSGAGSNDSRNSRQGHLS